MASDRVEVLEALLRERVKLDYEIGSDQSPSSEAIRRVIDWRIRVIGLLGDPRTSPESG